MIKEKTTTYNIDASVHVCTQKGTEAIDLTKLLKNETTTIWAKGDNVEVQIVLMPLSKTVLCRLGLVLKENIE